MRTVTSDMSRVAIPALQMVQTLARWCTSSDHQVARYAQPTIARMFFFGVEERNDSWITLAAKVFPIAVAKVVTFLKHESTRQKNVYIH